jgi:hypothetical protein
LPYNRLIAIHAPHTYLQPSSHLLGSQFRLSRTKAAKKFSVVHIEIISTKRQDGLQNYQKAIEKRKEGWDLLQKNGMLPMVLPRFRRKNNIDRF